jgi:hypothetical protein
MGPAFLPAGLERADVNAERRRPIRDRECPAVGMRKVDIVATVSELLVSRCPSTIIFRIPLVVVDTVEFQLRAKRWLHVLKEIYEVVPGKVYENASATVVRIFWVVRTVASAHHPFPTFVNLACWSFVRSQTLLCLIEATARTLMTVP